MKFVSYGPPRAERAGVWSGDAYVDLEHLMQASGIASPTADLKVFLGRADWKQLLPTLAAALPNQPTIGPAGVRLGAPIPRPGQVLLAGVNYRSHHSEVLGDATPRRPVVLGKVATAVVGPYDDVVRPPEILKLDYEGEVAVVIGRQTRRVPRERVADHIAGYTVMNDISGRDLQLAEHETNPFFRMHYLGKSVDTFAPLGPCLVTADELDLSRPFTIRTWVDEELRQDGDTSQLIFSIEEFISYVATFVTLYPGDVISTGTPGGVAHYMQPPRYLQHGQHVRVEVPGIGELRNRVCDETVAQALTA